MSAPIPSTRAVWFEGCVVAVKEPEQERNDHEEIDVWSHGCFDNDQWMQSKPKVERVHIGVSFPRVDAA